MEKTYTLSDGTKFIFEYDHNRMGIITLECMDTLMSLLKATAEQTEPKPCEWCKFSDGENCFSQEPCKVMLYFKTEPQTDCGDFAGRLAYERGVKHAWEVAQKVFDSTVTFYEAEDVAKQITKPQTDCSWKKGE